MHLSSSKRNRIFLIWALFLPMLVVGYYYFHYYFGEDLGVGKETWANCTVMALFSVTIPLCTYYGVQWLNKRKQNATDE